MSRSNPPSPGAASVPIDPLMAAYTAKRRPSRSEAGGSTPPRTVSPLPAPASSTQPYSTSATAAASPSVSSSLLSAGTSVQHAAGSWWKRASASASALYQQAAQQLADEQARPSKPRSRRNSAASPDSSPAASSGIPAHPTISSSATSPSFTSASPSQSTGSSFLSSVLSSVSAAVSNVSALSNSTVLASSSPHPGAVATHDASADSETSEAEVGFVELDLLDSMFEHPNAYLSTASPASSSSSSPSSLLAPPTIPGIDQSPLSLSVARLSLLASVLSTESGGYLSPTVFFPRAALFVPSLRLPALPQKLNALERFDEMMEEAESRTAGGRAGRDGQQQQDEMERWQATMAAVLASCHKLQNELAFSLSSIKESHASSTTSVDGEGETVTADDGAAATEPSGAASSAGFPLAGSVAGTSSSSSHHSAGLTVDKLSSRMKAFGYSVAKTASRLSKQVLQDRVSREQADVYASLVARIARHMQRMQQHYSQLSGGEGEKELQSRVNELGVFVCEVLVVLIADDLQRCMAVYTQQQQEALTRGHMHAHVLQLEQEARRTKSVQQRQEGEATAAYAERAEASAATLYAEMLAQPLQEATAAEHSTDVAT